MRQVREEGKTGIRTKHLDWEYCSVDSDGVEAHGTVERARNRCCSDRIAKNESKIAMEEE